MQYGGITPAILRVPNTSKQGRESAMPHKWAVWLHNPRCLGGPQRFRAGERINSARQVAAMAT